MHNYLKIKMLRPIFINIFASIVLLATTLLQTPAFAKENLTAIINAVIIDGNGGTPIENGTIIIEGEQIKSVGANIRIPQGAKIIDAAGQTAMPGLADMHVHLADGGGLLGYQRRLNALLYSGVTTVMDMGGVMPFVQQMRQAIEADRIPGPHIYYVGPLIDSVDPQWPAITRSMASSAQAPGIVKYLKKNGADAVKAYAKLNRGQIRALVEAGEKEGLPVILDAWFQNGGEHLVTTGVRAFAHTPRRVTDDTLNTMKEEEVYIVTTRAVGGVAKNASVRGSSFLESDLIRNTTPPWELQTAQEDIARALADDEFVRERFSKPFFDLLQGNVKQLFDAGIPLVAGTDNDGLFIGETLHFELELLVGAGLTPLQVITTATKNAAMLMKDEDQWGTLEPGKRADILLVSGRPDKNISDTRNIEMVMQEGREVKREKLVFDEEADKGFRELNADY
jgi:imidazolonepropionase-like amidohydrolase